MNINETLLILLLVQLTFQVNAQYQTTGNEKGTAFYLNPVFAGDYPDPGILKDGDEAGKVFRAFITQVVFR